MGSYNLNRPGGTVYVEDGDPIPPGGTLVGAPFADGAGPYPIGKSSDYAAREAADITASGGKSFNQMDDDEVYFASQVFNDDVAGAITPNLP